MLIRANVSLPWLKHFHASYIAYSINWEKFVVKIFTGMVPCFNNVVYSLQVLKRCGGGGGGTSITLPPLLVLRQERV